MQGFLLSFKDLERDTLLVKSAEIADSLGDFFGNKIDTTFYKFINHNDVEWARRADYNFFGCYKFNLNRDTIGLIMRCPSACWESSIKLLLFSKKTSLTFDWVELAQVWGDAGDSEKKYSYLVTGKNQHLVNLFVEYCYSLDEDLEKFECGDSTYIFEIAEGINLKSKQLTDPKHLASFH